MHTHSHPSAAEHLPANQHSWCEQGRPIRLLTHSVFHASVACLCCLLTCSLLCLQVVPGVPFFASRVQLGPEGVAKINGLGPLTDFEKQGLDAMLPELKTQIEKGLAFAKQ